MDKKSNFLYDWSTKTNPKKGLLSMKSITEILGGSQRLLGISYDIQDIFEDYLSENHRTFLSMLSVIEEDMPHIERDFAATGRKPYCIVPFIRAYLGKPFFKLATTRDLMERLKNDSSFRKISGFVKIPSEATFSRYLALLSNTNIMERILNKLVVKYHEGHIIGHISRDSTSIESREKPVNKKKDVKELEKPKRKRGRPRKDEIVPSKEEKRLSKQVRQKPGKAFKELNKRCAWGGKRNSQGNNYYWKGYKLHLDVTDLGVPISAAVTGANVHDSQVAIPMEKMTEKKIIHLYSLMDSAYDAPQIRQYIISKGRKALIDFNKRRKKNVSKMCPAEKNRYKIRSTVERAYSHLKDWFIPEKIYLRGYIKVKFSLLSSVLCLAAMKILQFFCLPEALRPA